MYADTRRMHNCTDNASLCLQTSVVISTRAHHELKRGNSTSAYSDDTASRPLKHLVGTLQRYASYSYVTMPV